MCLPGAVITALRAYAISGRHWYATALIISLLLVGIVYDIVRDSQAKLSVLNLRTPECYDKHPLDVLCVFSTMYHFQRTERTRDNHVSR